MSQVAVGALVLLVGVGVFVLVFAIRRSRPDLSDLDTAPASAILGWVAAAFGILLGFVIVFLLGEASEARSAVGDEATSIGTAFDEAQLFPEGESDIQHALICYSKAVTEVEWPLLADRTSSAVADQAYRDLIATYGQVDAPTDGTFQPAAATNTFAQLGAISTARESRIVVASYSLGGLMWILLLASAVLVLSLLFVVTVPARPIPQAALMALASTFTAVLLLFTLVLNNPFRNESGPVNPALIEGNTARMMELAPEAAARPCSFE